MKKALVKPIIFFSHSSKDKLFLETLKDLLNERTRGVVDIFLSSDGQSIPFGKNWVKQIEDALRNASVMFVFISPSSYSSKWLNFEAGYGYSNKIEVVPVGILGLDLYKIEPPLSLLQGFNCDNPNSLDNIIAVINNKCVTNFKSAFTPEEYTSLFQNAREISSSSPISYMIIGMKISSGPENDDLLKTIINDEMRNGKINLVGTGMGSSLRSNGFELNFDLKNRRISTKVDKLVAGVYLPIITDLFEKKVVEPEDAEIYFEDGLSLAASYLRQSALLNDTDVQVKEGEEFAFQGIAFRIHHFSASGYIAKDFIRMDIIFHNNFISNEWLELLSQILVDSQVLE